MTALRKINLIEILKDQLESDGVDLPKELTDEQLGAWSEEQIRKYYTKNGHSQEPPQKTAPSLAHQTSPPAAAVGAQSPNAEQQLGGVKRQLAELQVKFADSPDPTAFKAWFPGLALTKTETSHPKAVVLCFHSSGNAEDMFTSEGTGSRRVPSPLLEACRTHGWKLLAAQLPGRGLRAKEPHMPNLQAVAAQLVPLVAPVLLSAGGQYAMVAHSMGCWAAYELLLLLLKEGFPEPAVVCFSAMPWPHIPMQQRPWRQQKALTEDAFKDECKGWDINDIVFGAGMWNMYQPMLRADFKLFDEYIPSSSSSSSTSTVVDPKCNGRSSSNGNHGVAGSADKAKQPDFNFPMRLFYGSQDRRVEREMVQNWSKYTTADCKMSCIEGNHLFPLQPTAKTEWLKEVAIALSGALG